MEKNALNISEDLASLLINQPCDEWGLSNEYHHMIQDMRDNFIDSIIDYINDMMENEIDNLVIELGFDFDYEKRKKIFHSLLHSGNTLLQQIEDAFPGIWDK